MGLLGITIGLTTEIVGIIKGDDELVKKGAKRVAFGYGSMLVGDVFGVSDSVDAIVAFSDNSA